MAAATVRTPDGAHLAYDVTGAGPTLLLLHGITESRRSWDPLVAPLARDRRVVTVDLRGHGESARQPPYDTATLAADLRAVTGAIGGEPPLVIGHSLGGAVGSLYAATEPVRGVVNIDQSLALAGVKTALEPLAPVLRGADAGFQALLAGMFDQFYDPLPAPEQARLRALADRDRAVVLGVWETVLDNDIADLDALIRAATSAIHVPYLALHGSDPGTDYVAWLRDALPSATVEVWPDHGHYPHLVEPDRFVARVREFDAGALHSGS